MTTPGIGSAKVSAKNARLLRGVLEVAYRGDRGLQVHELLAAVLAVQRLIDFSVGDAIAFTAPAIGRTISTFASVVKPAVMHAPWL